MASETIYAVVDGVKLTEEQLRTGLDQIDQKKKAATVKRGEFKAGDVVFFVGGSTESITPNNLRLAVRVSDDGQTATVLTAGGMLHKSVPTVWYAKAPKGHTFTVRRES